MRVVRWGATALAAVAVFASSAEALAQTNLVTNGGFTAGLTGWTVAPSSTGSAAGTCSYNADGTPGTEVVTTTSGFTSANPSLALGSVSLSAAGIRSCVLYQDIAIPVGATTLTLSGDLDVKSGGTGNVDAGSRAYVFGLFATDSVPSAVFGSIVPGARFALFGGSLASELGPVSTTVPVADYAGTTVRLAIINVILSPSGGSGAPVADGFAVIGASNVKAVVTVPAVPTDIPTLSEFGRIGLTLLLVGGALHQLRRRKTA